MLSVASFVLTCSVTERCTVCYKAPSAGLSIAGLSTAGLSCADLFCDGQLGGLGEPGAEVVLLLEGLLLPVGLQVLLHPSESTAAASLRATWTIMYLLENVLEP